MRDPSPRDARPDAGWAAWWDAPDGVDDEGWRRDAEAFALAARPVLGLTEDDDLLDWGCGPGFVLRALSPLVRSAVGADPSPRLLERARRETDPTRVTLALLDLRAPLASPVLAEGTYSVVLVHSVLQYLPDHEALDATVAGLMRALRPGGRLLMSDLPASSGRVRDAWGFLRGARRQRRLCEALRRLLSLARSDYAKARKRLGLLVPDPERLRRGVEAAGGTLERVDAPLTVLAHRRHWLARRGA